MEFEEMTVISLQISPLSSPVVEWNIRNPLQVKNLLDVANRSQGGRKADNHFKAVSRLTILQL
jgi:hypothetical protein